ncbi:hypothetical protein DICPUDRAFT_160000 [Dictyostelium purpureum]|uniref:Uncharacterized protein n=1 Tax=Dictyostelium purpureum TaxID=5786 RepID=F1A5G6_DICPU|nr:uncharacterized protein DICPUDRAFT_160000 [Dictyostelium purpureum]EGC28561.1 hypothetical protein DICPUDRAFT_160000 [Dictyostelium purpureum]|eukprot:XP_003294911.1 hypothetical protein DICPUDRAFT_160000 [Dictyostelium purpureum]
MVTSTKKTSNKISTTNSSGKLKPTLNNKKNDSVVKKPLLSEEIMDIVTGASNIKKSIDPESMDYFGDSAKVDQYEDFGDINDENSGSRLRGDIDSGFTSGKYSGKKSSRKNERDEEDEFNPEEEIPSEDDKDLDDVFDFDDKEDDISDDDDDNIVQSSNIDKADQLFKKLQKQQQQSNEKDEKEPKLLNNINESDEMEKAKNTKNQTVLYNEFLTTRIYLQKAISFANRLPKPKAYKEFIEYDKSIENKFEQVKKQSCQLVSELFNLQSELIDRNEEMPKSTNKKKRIREDQSLSEVWNIIDEQNQRLNEFHNATITKWNNRISISGTTTTKNLKSLNQSILTQISNTLNDIERLQKRTKLKRSTYKIFGDQQIKQQQPQQEQQQEQDEDEDEYDDEIFDDSDFYQNLLKELENSNDDDQNQVGSQYWIEMRNLKKKKKKKVNQKASKGRILRYEVFPKLENFMTPIQIPDPDWNIDQLYQNLFGGVGNIDN